MSFTLHPPSAFTALLPTAGQGRPWMPRPGRASTSSQGKWPKAKPSRDYSSQHSALRLAAGQAETSRRVPTPQALHEPPGRKPAALARYCQPQHFLTPNYLIYLT
ncbi:Wilms tumor protein-like protein A [Platysternon megacephalum]|uniref:Wilms tumor protein-like protein A n=1 Tax=Platysternon megacephalum TaxID=55544 RepID=A0A4D9EXJ4_9SAUR|nr:Wilms tumor protein-like protein A [Platysternon megacephalum]